MRVSDQFALPYSSSELDFLDIDVAEDRVFFVDPHAIRLARTEMSRAATRLVADFFAHLLALIKAGDDRRAYRYLTYLLEPNETHLGYSANVSRGRALGPDSAADVLSALKKSSAVQSGLLRDLEDAALLIEGIDRDIVSDMATNIIRPILITYTQQMAALYRIPTRPVRVGPIWDTEKYDWRTGDVADLPVGPRGALLFVPKLFVRITFERDQREYYRNYIAPALAAEEIAAGTELVKLLKNGEARVWKKDLKAKYGACKRTTIEVTQRRPPLLDEYRTTSGERMRRSVSQEEVAAVLKAPKANWPKLAAKAVAIPAGVKNIDARGSAALGFMTALLHPNVTFPQAMPTVGDFRAWRFDAVVNAEGPLTAALAQLPSDAVDVLVVNDDLVPQVVPELLNWLDTRDRAALTILIARSVDEQAAAKITSTVPGVTLFGDADLVAFGDLRATGPEALTQLFVLAD